MGFVLNRKPVVWSVRLCLLCIGPPLPTPSQLVKSFPPSLAGFSEFQVPSSYA